MSTKAELTAQYILETVAPIFNKKGYTATSMSDLTTATGLTKGAIYGNFTNKEELSLKAFNYNVRFVINKIKVIFDEIECPIEKLKALTDFYRTYNKQTLPLGGCPVLNVGIDSNNTHPELFKRVKEIAKKLTDSIASIIKEGQAKAIIKSDIDAELYGGRIFSFIEGSIFTSVLLKNDKYLIDMMDHIDDMIHNELKK
jgi:AcrR family transcriptional regulator